MTDVEGDGVSSDGLSKIVCIVKKFFLIARYFNLKFIAKYEVIFKAKKIKLDLILSIKNYNFFGKNKNTYQYHQLDQYLLVHLYLR